SLASAYTYTNGPVVTGISPNTCPTTGNQSITVSGFNFGTTIGANTVNFGTTAGTVTGANITGTSLIVTCPAHAAGTVDIFVTTANGTSPATLADQLTYANTGPAVTSLTPTLGTTGGGTIVTIFGQNFTGVTGVTFGGTTASFTFVSATQITAISPVHAGGGTVDVQVTTPAGTSPANPPADTFSYTDTGTCGSVLQVVITGTNFTVGGGAMTVQFGGVNATSFTVPTTTTIQAVVPAHAAGAADVRVTTGNGTGTFNFANGFTYTCAGAPAVTSVSPSTGAPGSTVTITGSGFTGVVCPSGVTFGTVQASACTVNSDTSITATVPNNVPSGTSDVR